MNPKVNLLLVKKEEKKKKKKKQLRAVYSSGQRKTNPEDGEGKNLFSSVAMFKQICSKS